MEQVRETQYMATSEAAPRKLRGAIPQRFWGALAGVILAGCAAFLYFGHTYGSHVHHREQVRAAERAAKWLAQSLADVSDDSAIQRQFERSCQLLGAAEAVFFDARGAAGQRWPQVATSAPAVNPNRDAPRAAAEVIREGKIAGRVELTLPWQIDATGGAKWTTGALTITALLLIALLFFYRSLNAHARPYIAIEQSIQNYTAGLERQFSALTLSDTLGQMAVAWNTLVEDVAKLQAQISAAGQPGAASALQRLEARTLRHILDRLPIGVLRLGSDRSVNYANCAAQRLLRAQGEVVGKSIGEILGDPETAEVLALQSASASAKPLDRQFGSDDAAMTLRLSLVPLLDMGSPGENVLTIEDVSHLQESEKARDQFLYHVTHELRTPLTNIQAYAETLTKPGFDDEQTRRECYNVIISETRRLSRLVEDILSISQLEVGAARFDVGDVDMAKLVRQTVQDNLGGADGKKVELSLKIPPKMPRLRGDKQRLSVLLNNLIGNAIKYTPSGGRVTVAVEVQDRVIQVQVNDTGLGINPEDQKRIFEKFYRATSDSVQAIPGTGLGLAIAREVARLHGGDISVQSELGKGSQFTLELPVPVSGEEK